MSCSLHQFKWIAADPENRPRGEDTNRDQTRTSALISEILQPSGHAPAPVSAASHPDEVPEESTNPYGPNWKGKARNNNSNHPKSYQPSITSNSNSSLFPREVEATTPSEPSLAASLLLQQYHTNASLDEQPPLSRTTTSTTIPASASTSAAASIFSRPLSHRTSLTSPSLISTSASTATVKSLATSTITTKQWVDSAGICHNPTCQSRTYIQRKAFRVYARVAHSNASLAGVKPEPQGKSSVKMRITCEHILLYYQDQEQAMTIDEDVIAAEGVVGV
jgi:hypothetical protein